MLSTVLCTPPPYLIWFALFFLPEGIIFVTYSVQPGARQLMEGKVSSSGLNLSKRE